MLEPAARISKENSCRQKRAGFGLSSGSNFGFIICYDIANLIANTPFSPPSKHIVQTFYFFQVCCLCLH